jgi:hypothetical protein
MSMSHRERRLAVITVVVGGAVGLYLAVDRWVIPKFSGLQKQISAAKTDLSRLSKQRDHLKAMSPQAAYDEQVKHVMVYPTTVEAEQVFMRQLNSLAGAAQMPTPNIGAGSVKRFPDFDVVEFDFKVTCNLLQLVTFLRKFYTDDRAQRVESISALPTGRQRADQETMLNVTMRISTVVMPPPGAKPAPARRGGRA